MIDSTLALSLAILSIIPFFLLLFGMHKSLLSSPAFWVFICFFIGSFTEIIYFVFFRSSEYNYWLNDRNFIGNSLSYIIPAQIAACLAAWSYFLGYLIKTNKTEPHGHQTPFPEMSYAWVVLITTGSLAVFFLTFILFFAELGLSWKDLFKSSKRFLEVDGQHPSQFSYLLYSVIKLTRAGFYVSLLYLVSQKRSNFILFLFILSGATIVYFQFFLSARMQLIFVFLDMMILYIYFNGKINFSKILAVSLVIFPVLVVMTNQRSQTDDSAGQSSAIASVGRAATEFYEYRYFVDVPKIKQIILAYDKELPFFYGRSFYEVFLNSLPVFMYERSVDNRRVGKELANEVFDEPNNDVPPGYLGELYINFGYAGIALGFLLLGFFHNTIERGMYQGRSLLLLLVYIFLITRTSFLLINSDFSKSFTKVLFDVVTILPFVYITLKVSHIKKS